MSSKMSVDRGQGSKHLGGVKLMGVCVGRGGGTSPMRVVTENPTERLGTPAMGRWLLPGVGGDACGRSNGRKNR